MVKVCWLRGLDGVGASALMVGLLTASPVQAQDAATGDGTQTVQTSAGKPTAEVKTQDQGVRAGDIVVTARRRAENIQDVPISVTAFSGESLTRQGVSDINGVQALVPSLTVTNAGSQRDAFTFAIRGQRTNEIQLLTDPPVGTYFAEVVQPRPFGFGNTLYDISSVQVLKGVQGTLFGRNVTGGAVLVEPNRPTTDRIHAEVVGQYGNYDMRDLYGMVNLPFGEWGALRIAGKTRRRDGFVIDQSDGRDYDNQSYDTFRVSLLLKPTDWLESVTIGDWYRSRQHGSAVIPDYLSLFNTATNQPTVLGQLEGTRAAGAAGLAGPASPLLAQLANVPAQFAAIQAGRKQRFFSFDTSVGEQSRLNVFDRQPYANLDNKGITNRTVADLGFAKLKNVFGYREIDYDRLVDLDGLPAHLIEARQFTFIKQYSNELQLQGDLGRLNYTIGGFYFLEKGIDGQEGAQFPELTLLGIAATGAPINPFTAPASTVFFRTPGEGKATSYATYAAGTFALTDQVKLSGGVRYNYDKRRVTANGTRPNLFGGTCLLDLNDDGVPDGLPLSQCSVNRSVSFDQFTWDATVQYEPSPELTTYASTRKGYRAGGYNLRAQSNLELQPFAPEKVQEYEVGLKTRNNVGPALLTSSFAVFYQNYSDVQKQSILQSPGGLIGSVTNNTTKQRNYGGEAEVNVRFDQGFSFGLSYAYVGAEIVKGGNGSFVLVGVPKHQIGVNAGFDHKLGSLGTFLVNGNLSFRSEQFLDDYDVEARQPSYALVNIRMGLSDIGGSGFGIAAFATNLTNERYRLGVVGLLDQVGYQSSIYGEPRMYGVEGSFRF